MLRAWQKARHVNDWNSRFHHGHWWCRGLGLHTANHCRQKFNRGRNSTEAEIIASTDATPKAVRWRNFMEAASHEQQGSTDIYLDNESNVCNMFNLSGANTQHLNKRLAYSRDVVQRKLIRPRSVPGKRNCADILTKSLPTPDFVRHADTLLGITHARTFL